MPLLGAHLSVAGGFHNASDEAGKLGMDTVQIFTGNPRQFATGVPKGATPEKLPAPNENGSKSPLTSEAVELFRASVETQGLQKPCSHASYLINMASPKDELWVRSLLGFELELRRAEALGLVGVVVHPGSYTESSEDEGLARIIRALDEIHARNPDLKVETWLETTAGQGTNLGWRFAHIGRLLKGVAAPHRVGVCLDTCHVFAAGYPIGTEADYAETMEEFDHEVGVGNLRALHLNDSKQPFGSRKDRHEHIGEGEIGRDAFRNVLTDKRLADLPMYLETPKEGHPSEEPADPTNLALLRTLMSA